jgi:hypothetical protein
VLDCRNQFLQIGPSQIFSTKIKITAEYLWAQIVSNKYKYYRSTEHLRSPFFATPPPSLLNRRGGHEKKNLTDPGGGERRERKREKKAKGKVIIIIINNQYFFPLLAIVIQEKLPGSGTMH